MARVPRNRMRGYCQRTGDRVHPRELVREPGTGLLVRRKVSDDIYNRSIYDPRNRPPAPNPNEGKPRWFDEPDPYPEMEVGNFLETYNPNNDSEFERA